ncbi:MAG: type II secretion system ATPase GspE [Candidatus Omnitrophica bacterium]|nr:type II secretion system ATPase GspE [Candidatus Omnitrophota bacterium]
MAKEQKKSLGESLAEEGIITAEQLKQAREEEKRTGQRLRNILVKMGLIAEEDLVALISEKLGLPRIELSNYLIDPKIVELVPEALARKYELIPVLKIGNRLTCAMVDPWNIFALDEIRAKTNLIIEPAVATESEIKQALNEHYGAKGSMEDLIKTIDEKKLGIEAGKEIDAKKLQGIVEEPVVIKLVNLIIMQAVKEGASDIHIEPEEEALNIRLRVDGMLHEISSPPKHLQSAIISRIKILANLDIAERRAPQDGRFTVNLEGRQIDIRVSNVPTIYGENVVLRLLDVSTALLGLGQLGFSQEILDKYSKLITRPHGIILVTGPTGSGKTTTLYASLAKINTVEKNIITIEDPVEYKLAGIRQIQVNPKVDLTFASGLRSILRQDPDIIMVGEMRDLETAEIAIQAALTGHLVLSTLHTNDAPGAITRLMDMGVEPFLASSSIIGILAQRLVRKICPGCKEEYTPAEEALKDIGLLNGRRTTDDGRRELLFYRGKGCAKCMNTGYKGRISIYELMLPDDKIRNAIVAKSPAEEIRKLACLAGMAVLMEDGIEKVKAGITTIEEVLRVTREE